MRPEPLNEEHASHRERSIGTQSKIVHYGQFYLVILKAQTWTVQDLYSSEMDCRLISGRGTVVRAQLIVMQILWIANF